MFHKHDILLLKIKSIAKIPRPVLFVVSFAALGAILLFVTRAGTPFASLESEQGALTPNASVINDSTASNGSAVQFSPPAASTGWALADSSLNNLRQANETVTALQMNNEAVYVSGNEDGKQNGVPAGWVAKPTVKFESYAKFEQMVIAGTLDPSFGIYIYDPEKWDLTPVEEQLNAPLYMKKFCDLAHSKGWVCMNAPARSLLLNDGGASSIGTAWCHKVNGETLSQAAIRCQLYAQAAYPTLTGDTYAERIDMQFQSEQNNAAQYASFVKQARDQAFSVNPNVIIRSNLTTEFQGVAQDPANLCAAHRAVKGIVQGHWLHVSGATGQVGTDLLQMIENGQC